MKKCPFCAEEIQDEAIKCRYCNSFLSAAPPATGAPATATPPAPQPVVAPTPAPAPAAEHHAPFARATPKEAESPRKTFYEGVPSWKAYFGHYVLTVFVALLVIGGVLGLSDDATPTSSMAVRVLIPAALTAIVMFAITLYRKSIKFRITNTVIETERGIISKSIDVLQLWRCRDVRYRQSLVDRMLGIAHIDVFAQDATTPQLEITGMPSSRQLFENLRDSIELQRAQKNVYGVVS